jgi:HEAT repeat protein
VRLGDLRAGHTLETLVRDSFNASLPDQKDMAPIDSEQADDLIRNKMYQCLFLLDDLDVLLSMHNESGLDALIYFMEAYRQHQYLIACRTSSYRGQVGPVDTLYLDNLSEQETRSVLGDDFNYEQLSSALKDLACNRAMLNIILELDDIAFKTETKGQLVRRWVKKQLEGQENAELTELAESLCERLAFSMQSEHARIYTEQQLMSAALSHLQEWHERYTWREVLNRSRDCELLSRDEESHQWQFRDRQAEAYFAAAAVLHDPAKLAFVLTNASDYRWRELLEILIGLMPEPSELLFELIERDVNVAAEIFRFAGSAVDHRVVDALIDALIESMGHQSSTVRKRIVERIGESGHPRVPEALVQALHREWSSMVLMAIIKALWQWTSKHPDAVKQVNDIERRSMYSLPWEAKSIGDMLTLYVGAAAGRSPESTRPLIDLLNDRTQVRLVRGLAAFGLALLGTQTAAQALIAVVRDMNADDFVAWCSADALAQYPDAEVKTTAMALWTEEQYQGEGGQRHRARAVYLLGWTGIKMGTDTYRASGSGSPSPAQVLNAALNDQYPLIRGYALGAVARLDMHDARQRIEQILAAETEPWVLRRAAEALGQIGTLDSISVLKRYERHERVQTRSKVRKAIAEIRQRYGLE